ncbi:TatA/E family protein of Tat protein translocase [Symbiobacterium terraclitae]|uniref:Sec-independent protein translocase protein TatA n=1 Tax=Symbiobacterium terraclitae TaxID=557451 RepID=A0ABS4JRQ6_9FIRM|nr:twin-arginine translocase TatA/TatE family subunit [Symbiobacterium terraclitae]MBP2017134.1 TatA/E family protein of Tat protein translocase [Symbiobacterium terraclitae]
MSRIGTTEIILILVVALLIFGPAKLPQLARSVGESIRGFKESMKGGLGEDIAEVKKELQDIKDSVTK